MSSRVKHLRYTYGISEDHYMWLLNAQKGVCAICESPDPKNRWGKFSIDHCHTTNAIRGLLCLDCNTGLGKFKERISIFMKAISYLEHQGFSVELKAAEIALPKAKGRRWVAETHQRKLTKKKVEHIRYRLARGETQTSVAKAYGVSQAMISRIVLGKSWVLDDGRRF